MSTFLVNYILHGNFVFLLLIIPFWLKIANKHIVFFLWVGNLPPSQKPDPITCFGLGMLTWSCVTLLSSGLYFFGKVCDSKTLACLTHNSCWIKNFAFIQCSCFTTYGLQLLKLSYLCNRIRHNFYVCARSCLTLYKSNADRYFSGANSCGSMKKRSPFSHLSLSARARVSPQNNLFSVPQLWLCAVLLLGLLDNTLPFARRLKLRFFTWGLTWCSRLVTSWPMLK